MADSSRTRKRPAEDNPALPDLSADMSLSAIRQLPVAALRQYAVLYKVPCKGTKQAVSQLLYDHLQAQHSDSASESQQDESSSHESPEGERSPSRASNSRSGQRRKHSRNRHSRKSSSSTSGDSPPVAKRLKRHRRRHSSTSSSSTSEHSSRSQSTSSSTSSTPRRRLKHRRRYASSPSSTQSSSPTRRVKRKRSHTRHIRSKRFHRRRHTEHRGSSTTPLPHKLQVAIKRGEFVDLSDLLSEHLTMSGKSSKSRRATQSRCITTLDTWLEAWSLYATVLAAAKPHLASDLFKYQSFITHTSRRFQTYAWLQYDSQFRLKLAAN